MNEVNDLSQSAAGSPPELRVAVLMRREAVQGPMARWQPWRWTLHEVLIHQAAFGQQPRCMRESNDGSLWIYPDWPVTLYTDDAEGYWLNTTAPAPAFFVMWRMSEPVDGSEARAVPQEVSLSYHDAGGGWMHRKRWRPFQRRPKWWSGHMRLPCSTLCLNRKNASARRAFSV